MRKIKEKCTRCLGEITFNVDPFEITKNESWGDSDNSEGNIVEWWWGEAETMCMPCEYRIKGKVYVECTQFLQPDESYESHITRVEIQKVEAIGPGIVSDDDDRRPVDVDGKNRRIDDFF